MNGTERNIMDAALETGRLGKRAQCTARDLPARAMVRFAGHYRAWRDVLQHLNHFIS